MHLECGHEKFDHVMALLNKERRTGKVVIDTVYIILHSNVLTPANIFLEKRKYSFTEVMLKVNAELKRIVHWINLKDKSGACPIYQ